MKIKLNLLITIVYLIYGQFTKSLDSPMYFDQVQKVYIYSKTDSIHSESIKAIFNKFGVKYEIVNAIDNDDKNLYIIFDIFNLDEKTLPKYYIAYQSLDLDKSEIADDYLNKLFKAVAVWDYKMQNIVKYRSLIHNYYYMPGDYEYADPVILPCFLPLEVLPVYKKVLVQSNNVDTDSSSHLPAIFTYSYLKQPARILEVGVASGGTTSTFHRAAQFSNAKLIGVEIQDQFAPTYSNLNNALFLCMDDLDFPEYYKNSEFNNKKMDVIFIDTSHEYEHTLQEIKIFAPLLDENGLMLFHDSNVTPLHNNTKYLRLNNTAGFAHGNSKGVTYALKEYFSVSFDESKYFNSNIVKDNFIWKMIHYPFCNGLTVLKKMKRA